LVKIKFDEEEKIYSLQSTTNGEITEVWSLKFILDAKDVQYDQDTKSGLFGMKIGG